MNSNFLRFISYAIVRGILPSVTISLHQIQRSENRRIVYQHCIQKPVDPHNPVTFQISKKFLNKNRKPSEKRKRFAIAGKLNSKFGNSKFLSVFCLNVAFEFSKRSGSKFVVSVLGDTRIIYPQSKSLRNLRLAGSEFGDICSCSVRICTHLFEICRFCHQKRSRIDSDKGVLHRCRFLFTPIF